MLTLTTVSLLSLTTRRTTGIESYNVQAFHVAQAGLDRARVYASTAVDTAPPSEDTAGKLAVWLAARQPGGLSGTASGGSYTVKLTANRDAAGNPDGTVTIESTGTGPNNRARARLQLRAMTSISQYTAPFTYSNPGGLVASGNVQLRGNNPISGYELPGLPATTTTFTCTLGTGSNKKNCDGTSTFTLTGNFSRFAVGDYVDTNGSLFTVTGKAADHTTMTIQATGGTAPFPPGSVTRVDPILESAYAATTSASALTMRASAEQATGFVVNAADRLAAWRTLGVPEATLRSLAPAESQWGGYVRARDRANAVTEPFLETATNGSTALTVASHPAIARYSTLQRIIPSVVSGTGSTAVLSNGTNAVPYTGQTYGNFTASTLFGQTFNYNTVCSTAADPSLCAKQAYYAQATKVSFDELAASSSYYCGKVVWVGNAPGVTSPAATDRSVSLNCPPSNPATIVVNNEGATFDIGTQTSFNGMLYVIANNLAKQGNGCINGSVVIESSSPGMVADLRGTACPGGDQHDGYIKYDPGVLNTLSSYSATPQRNFDVSAASWREVTLP